MNNPRFPDIGPSTQRLNRRAFNSLQDTVEALARPINGFQTGFEMTSSGLLFQGNDAPNFWAKLTGRSDRAYAWTELIEDATGNLIETSDSMKGLTTAWPAYEATGQTDLATDGSVKVRLFLGNGEFYTFRTGGGDATGGSFLAKLTSSSGAAYGWTEQIPATGGTFTDGTRTGTPTVKPAYHHNLIRQLDTLDPQPIVRLFPGFNNTGSIGQEYEFQFKRLTIKDNFSPATIYDWVQQVFYDSTPTAYDPAKGDYVFTWNPTIRVLTIRLNGYTGNQTIVTNVTCNAGVLSVTTKVFSWQNGLLKTVV